MNRRLFIDTLEKELGKRYLDARTMYGDASRLFAVILAFTTPEILKQYYKLKWGCEPNIKPLQRLAKKYLRRREK